MTEVPNLAPLFRKAAEVIQTNGHVKGKFYAELDDVPPWESPVCAVGALRVAAGYDPDNSLGLDPWQATQFLSPRIYSGIVDSDPVERIADWNDAAERTPAEVVQALREAAEAAEQVMAA